MIASVGCTRAASRVRPTVVTVGAAQFRVATPSRSGVESTSARRKKAKSNGRAKSDRFSTPSWAEVPTWTWHDRQTLDDILADAVKVAARMGESLVYSLTPIATTGSKGGTNDA
jgi:hypothetical protein